MLLTKWREAINRWSARRSLTQVQALAASGVPLNRQWRLVKQALSGLSLGTLARYHPNHGMSAMIDTPYVSIEGYTTVMQHIARALFRNEGVNKEWINRNVQHVSVERFMLDTENRYIDHAVAFAQFIEAALHLCELMSTIEDSEEGVHGYNERLLLRFFEDLFKVSLTLLTLQVAILEAT